MNSQDKAQETSPRKNKPNHQPMIGKPSKYNPDIAEQICEQLSDGIPLREICRNHSGDPSWPTWRTMYDWMARDDALMLDGRGVGLSSAIARARDMGYDAIAEDCLAIADDGSNDWMERHDQHGNAVGWALNGEHVQRSKLRIETRLKLLAKFHPKKYGDKAILSGDAENPIEVNNNVTVFGELLKALKMGRQGEE